MRFIMTYTESLNCSKVSRIAYLNPEERQVLTDKTGRTDFAASDEGEVIADMGRVIPVTLGYLKDDLVAHLIVRKLTAFIIGSWPSTIDYESVAAEAELEAARRRAEEEDDDDSWGSDDDDDDAGFEGVSNTGLFDPEKYIHGT